jgi:hypothetical protein
MARSMVRAHPNSVGPSGNLNVRSGSIAAEIRCLRHVRSAPNNGLKSDVAALRIWAINGHSATSKISTGKSAAPLSRLSGEPSATEKD